MRVHELAKELGVTSKELLGTLEQMGVSGKSASSSVPEDLVPRLRASGGKATEAPKRREVLEPPPAPRKPKPKKAAAPKAEAKPADVAPAPVAEARRPPPLPRPPRPPPRPHAAPAAAPAPAADAAAAAAERSSASWPPQAGRPRTAAAGPGGRARCDAADDRREGRQEPGRHREAAVPGRRDGHRHHLAHGRGHHDGGERARPQRRDRRHRRRDAGHRGDRRRGRSVPAGAASAGGHRHGPRRPRQDQAAGRDPRDRRRRGRVRWHHPAHRRLSGARR